MFYDIINVYLLELKDGDVVEEIVLDAVVDVGDLRDVENAAFVQKVFLQFSPTADHQLPCLAVI
jgi:hypothetical protein